MWFYQCPACFDLPRRHFSLSGPIPQFSICFSTIFHVSSKSSIFPSRPVLQSCTWLCSEYRTCSCSSHCFSLSYTGELPLLFGWMISPPAGCPALARTPAKPWKGSQDLGWRLFPLSQSPLPPSFHRSECTDVFILRLPHFCSCSSALPSFQPST